jgi:hypothetical protein
MTVALLPGLALLAVLLWALPGRDDDDNDDGGPGGMRRARVRVAAPARRGR